MPFCCSVVVGFNQRGACLMNSEFDFFLHDVRFCYQNRFGKHQPNPLRLEGLSKLTKTQILKT